MGLRIYIHFSSEFLSTQGKNGENDGWHNSQHWLNICGTVLQVAPIYLGFQIMRRVKDNLGLVSHDQFFLKIESRDKKGQCKGWWGG